MYDVHCIHMYNYSSCVLLYVLSDEPDVEPKKKKHRISDDDGEESEHSVQDTVTKLHVHV